MLSGLCVTAAADDETGALAPHACITSDVNHYILGDEFNLNVSVRIDDVAEIEYLKINMNCDRNVIEYCGDGTVSNEGHACVFTIDETETGYVMTFSLDRSVNSDVFVLYGQYRFKVVKTGDPQIGFSGITKMLDTEPAESVLSIDVPANRVYETGELPEIVPAETYRFRLDGDIAVFSETIDRENALRLVYSTDFDCPVEMTTHYKQQAVATGDCYYIYAQDGRVCDEIYICILGDVDCDGKVSAADARLVLRHSAKLTEISGLAAYSADADRDGDINSSDARQILRVSACIDSFTPYTINMDIGNEITVGPLKTAGSGAYLWSCSVSDESGLTVETYSVLPDTDEIVDGAPAEQYFTLKGINEGTYTVHFELGNSWEDTPIDEYNLIVEVGS